MIEFLQNALSVALGMILAMCIYTFTQSLYFRIRNYFLDRKRKEKK